MDDNCENLTIKIFHRKISSRRFAETDKLIVQLFKQPFFSVCPFVGFELLDFSKILQHFVFLPSITGFKVAQNTRVFVLWHYIDAVKTPKNIERNESEDTRTKNKAGTSHKEFFCSVSSESHRSRAGSRINSLPHENLPFARMEVGQFQSIVQLPDQLGLRRHSFLEKEIKIKNREVQ